MTPCYGLYLNHIFKNTFQISSASRVARSWALGVVWAAQFTPVRCWRPRWAPPRVFLHHPLCFVLSLWDRGGRKDGLKWAALFFDPGADPRADPRPRAQYREGPEGPPPAATLAPLWNWASPLTPRASMLTILKMGTMGQDFSKMQNVPRTSGAFRANTRK